MSQTKKRNNVTYTLDQNNIDAIRALSSKTLIPQSRLMDEAIRDLIKKYNTLETLEGK